MKKYLLSLKNHLFTPMEISNGITGFGSIKFYIALAFYIAAFLVLAYDPFFRAYGTFTYKQGMVSLLLGFIIIAALNWEFLIFGKPAGANLFLQLMQLFPFSLLCARLLAKPSQPPVPADLLGSIREFLETSRSFLFSWVPDWIQDIFANWQISLLLVFILLIFCLRPLKLKIGALAFLFFYVIASNVENRPSMNLFLGIILLAVGWWLQFCLYSKVIFFENMVRKLRSSSKCGEIFARTVCRIMSYLYENQRISEETISQIVQTEYSHLQNYSGQDLKIISGEITRKMLFEYKLAELRCDSDGLFLYANPALSHYDGLLSWISVVPRVVLIFAIAVLWLVSPIDIIPDAIPIVGILDDVTVSLISALAIKNSVKELKQ